MRYLATAIALLSLSCAGPQVSPEVLRIVPLIKAERYDEAAADPDLLAPAFVEALREMASEGADPKRILAISDFFFEQYPFSIRDVAVHEGLFRAVADAHVQASTKLNPELPACARMKSAWTVQDKTEVLRSWVGVHDDGGRCARNVAEFLHRALASGPDWVFDPAFSRQRDRQPPGLLVGHLVEAAATPFQSTPWLPFMAMMGSHIRTMYGDSRLDAWADWQDVLDKSPWKRMFHARAAWLDALTQPSPCAFSAGAEFLAASRFDRRLREVGSALRAASKVRISLDGEPEDLPALTRAVEGVCRAGRGTPFPDVFRYAYVAGLVNSGRSDLAETWLQSHGKEFEHPLRHAYSWMFLCKPLVSAETISGNAERVLDLTRKALEVAPGASSSCMALLLRTEVYQERGLQEAVMACLEKALAIPDGASGPFEDVYERIARSGAGRMLAHLLLAGRKWERSLAAWETWEPYATSGLEHSENDLDQSLGIGRCLEELGRRRDAAEHYWFSVVEIHLNAEPARRLLEVHRSLRTLPELRDKLLKEVERSGGKVSDGLKLLAEELGVPVK